MLPETPGEATAVLDASAFLAYINDEDGADAVADALSRVAAMSITNWTEVLSKVADEGTDPERFTEELEAKGFLGRVLEIRGTPMEQAVAAGALSRATRPQGLSLGDRACLAFASNLGLPVLTTEHVWEHADLSALPEPVEIRRIR
jgi:PIN domain nuclease of toxin-antitoxin system